MAGLEHALTCALGLLAAGCLARSHALPPGAEGPEPAYRTSKPLARWWWFAGEIREEDVEHQLDWLASNGFGGVEIAWIYPPGRDPEAERFEWLGPEWSAAVAHAKRHADRIGLGCDFTLGTLWPFGGSFVPDADRTRVFGDPDFVQELKLSWEHPVIGNVIDHLDRGAFERYAERMGAALAGALEGSRSGLFCDSWEVETRRIWTPGFGEAFQERFGYDLRPFMEEIYEPRRAGERYDYMKLVSERVLEGFYAPFTETCHRLGAFSRVQCAGSPTDLIEAYASVDVPETEAMLYEPGFARIPASAAALASRPLVSSETFTCLYGFPGEHLGEERAADLKLVADALFANGVNQIFWHGMPYNPEGQDANRFYATVHVGPGGALAKELAAFNRYLETVSGILRRGRTFSDVAVYLPLEDAWIAGEYPPELQMPWSWGAYELRYVRPAAELSGYHPLWVNRGFLERGALEDGVLRCGDARFSALYVDVDHLDGAALDAILALAREGLPTCLKRRPREPGRIRSDTYEERLDELVSLANVSPHPSEVFPDAPLLAGDDLPDYWCRQEGDAHYLFFAHPASRDLHLPLSHGQARGAGATRRTIELTLAGETREIELRFGPGQSLLLRVDGDGGMDFLDIEYAPQGAEYD